MSQSTFRITRTTSGHTNEVVTGTVQHAGEASTILMNEVRDLIDRGFAFDAPEGEFPNTTSVARKGRTVVTLSVVEVEQQD